MQNRPHRRYFDKLDVLALSPILVVLFVFILLAIVRSSIFSYYYRDAENEESVCSIQYAAVKKHEDTYCQSFWYRTINDPSIFWNFYYSILTFFLVLLAGGTIGVALRSIAVQRNEAQRLFIADQRPWIKVSLLPDFSTIAFPDGGGMTFSMNILIENVGKSPAIKLVDSNLHFVQDVSGNVKSFEFFERMSNATKGMLDVGVVLFPKQEFRTSGSVRITKEQADATWISDERKLTQNVVMFCVAYKNALGSEIYETSLYAVMGSFTPIPRNKNEVDICYRTKEIQLQTMFVSRVV